MRISHGANRDPGSLCSQGLNRGRGKIIAAQEKPVANALVVHKDRLPRSQIALRAAGDRQVLARSKIPFPALTGDRFDDWMVGHQFEPVVVMKNSITDNPRAGA